MDDLTAVVLGHSYIRRLGDFIQRRLPCRLGLSGISLTVLGAGGARICGPRRHLRHEVDMDSVVGADIVFLHVGENDCERVDCATAAAEIYSLACELVVHYQVRCVIVGELLTFPVHRTNWSWQVNQILRHSIRSGMHHGQIRYWRQHRSFSRRACFCFDGVHLSNHMMSAYWNSVRNAVLNAARRLPSP